MLWYSGMSRNSSKVKFRTPAGSASPLFTHRRCIIHVRRFRRSWATDSESGEINDTK